MTEINNFEIIKSLINTSGDDEFYMLQIIHRSKDGLTQFDNGENGNFSKKLIKTYFIYSTEYLERKMDEITTMCKTYNARAYINLNKKSNKQVSLKALAILANGISREDYSCIKSLFETACGQVGACDGNKLWIVDIDTKDAIMLNTIKHIVNECEIEKFKDSTIVATIPTLNGFHLITRPFDKGEFKKRIGTNIDVHDNNPTLLYYYKN